MVLRRTSASRGSRGSPSAEQRDFVRKRVADRGVQHLVDVELRDYRDVAADGAFDAAASVEMGEHVGDEQYPEFLARLHGAVRRGGRVLIQQMSPAPGTPGGGPFIEAFIAPDMHMRPLGETVSLVERAGFEVCHVEAMREHYVRTGSRLVPQPRGELVCRRGGW